jgi:hypothetical protein
MSPPRSKCSSKKKRNPSAPTRSPSGVRSACPFFSFCCAVNISAIPHKALASGSVRPATRQCVSPYVGTMNGQTVALFCDGVLHEVNFGETWTANVTNLGAAIATTTLTTNGFANTRASSGVGSISATPSVRRGDLARVLVYSRRAVPVGKHPTRDSGSDVSECEVHGYWKLAEFGRQWGFGQQVEDVTPEEMQRCSEACMTQMSKAANGDGSGLSDSTLIGMWPRLSLRKGPFLVWRCSQLQPDVGRASR